MNRQLQLSPTVITHELTVTTVTDSHNKRIDSYKRIDSLIRNFESIKKIKESQEAAENSSFSFKVISEEELKYTITDLPINKYTTSGDIPTRILKQHAQIYSKKLADIFHESIKLGKFPEILKKAEVYKRVDMNDKENYRPLSILSNLSKVFEKLIYSQLNTYIGDKFSKYLT